MKNVLRFVSVGFGLSVLAVAGGIEPAKTGGAQSSSGSCFKDFYCQAEMGVVPSKSACEQMGGHSFRPAGKTSCQRL